MANPKGNPQNLKSYKPKWKSGKTQTIRVPIAIAPLVLEAARKIDKNKSKSLTQANNEVKTANEDNSSLFTVTSDSVINEALEILKLAIKPKKQGGSYASNNSRGIKEEVIKAITILENLTN